MLQSHQVTRLPLSRIICLMVFFLGFFNVHLNAQVIDYHERLQEFRSNFLEEHKEELEALHPVLDKYYDAGISKKEILQFCMNICRAKAKEQKGKQVNLDFFEGNPVSSIVTEDEIKIIHKAAPVYSVFQHDILNFRNPYPLNGNTAYLGFFETIQLREGDQVLIFGGLGNHHILLASIFKNMDISFTSLDATMVEKQYNLKQNEINIFTPEKLLELDGQYDVIIIPYFWIPNHTPKKILKRFEKIIKADGRLIMGGPYCCDGSVVVDNEVFVKARKKIMRCGFKKTDRWVLDDEQLIEVYRL